MKPASLVKIIATLLLILACFGWQVGSSWAYFSDTETSTGNTITVGVWDNSPAVSVIYPNGGEIFYILQTITIEWTATEPDGDLPLTIDIEFSPDSGQNYSYHIDTIEQDSQGDNKYDWFIPYEPGLISDNCRIKITATGPGGLSGWDESDEDFCPHLPPPPEVVVISPNGGEAWQVGKTCPITWVADGIAPQMMSIDIFLSPDGGISWIQIATDEENDGTYDWSIPSDAQPSDEGRIRIVAAYPFDVSGQDDSDEAFTLCEAAPPTPDEADYLVVDNTDASLSTEGKIVYEIALKNAGEDDITIDKLIISWDANEGDIRLVEIWSEAGTEWCGEQTSGSELDISDWALAPDEEQSISLTLYQDIPEEEFSIEFIMGDGSTMTVPIGPVDIADEKPSDE